MLTLVLVLQAAEHLRRAQTSPLALSKPLYNLQLLTVFLPPFRFVSAVSGYDRNQNLVLAFDIHSVCFSAVAFLNVTDTEGNVHFYPAATRCHEQQPYEKVGRFYQH